MPTYDYHCDACDHEFEVFHSITEEARRKCPKCGKNKLRRLIGAGAAIMFKGSGFYTTDYRSESYKKRAEADKPSSDSKPDSKSKSKSESKSESSKSDSAKSSKSEAKKSAAKDKS
jgi:putative FmdB family regulatory protein